MAKWNPSNQGLPPPNSLGAWLLGIRPKTLHAAICPVVLGTAYCFLQGAVHWPSAICALISSIFIQIGTNLANDYFDARQGADTPERLGPPRVVASGLLAPKKVFLGFCAAFGIAVLFGIPLILRAGWLIAVLGGISLLCGVLYTASRHSLAYLGLGDVFAFLFFGPIATAGTIYVQALQVSWLALFLGLIPGCYSLALIALNNLRDAPMDRKAGKMTLAARFGERFARIEILTALLFPCLAPLFFPFFSTIESTIIAFLTILSVLPIFRAILAGETGRNLNPLLGKIARSHYWVTLLWVVGLMSNKL